ncbi:MAG TPA: tetratricopeptide repeat protein [Pyrinomonadaceae bacterium]|nr:tetratricopeptide repeat protein [Pyrinomonadaceae bacterium]
MRWLKCSLASLLSTLTLVTFAYSQAQTPILPTEVDDFATLLITTRTSEERANLLANKKDLLTPALRRSLIRQGNVHLMAGQYASAFDIYSLTRNVAEQIGDKEGVATALLDIGTVYYFQANYSAALEQYQEARQLFLEVNNWYEAGKALSGLALIYKEQRRDAEALAALKQTLAEFTELNDKEEMANALSSIGSIYYSQRDYSAAAEAFRKSAELNPNAENVVRIADSLYMQGDYTQASRYYKQSLNELANQNNAAGLISSLNGAANSAYFQGNYDEALDYYQRSLVLERSQRDQLGVANAFRGIGNVHRSRGDYAAALESYFNALQISEVLKTNTGLILASVGLTRSLQNDNAAALDYYGKALERFKLDGNQIDSSRVLSLIGNSHYILGNLDLAVDSYQKGLSIREGMDDAESQADLQVGIGTVYLRKRDYADALSHYNAALRLLGPNGNKAVVASTLTRIADVYLAQGKYDDTFKVATQALNLAKDGANKEVYWYALLLIGKAQVALGKNIQGRDAFTSAVSAIESLRSEPTLSAAEPGRSSILAYHAAVDLFIADGNAAEALDYAERGKVQSLYEVFRRNNALSVRGMTPKEQTDERTLIGEAISLQLQLERDSQTPTSTAARQSSLNDRLQQTRAAYSAFRNQLFSAHPTLKVERGEVPALQLDEARMLVGDRQTALLEYVTTDRDTYLFVLALEENEKTSQRVRTATITLRAYPLNIPYEQLTALVNELQNGLTQNQDVTHNLQRVYDILLRPAAEQFIGRSRLVIVPDGVLWKVPFEALQPNGEDYVIDQFDVSYVPSLAALREFRKFRRETSIASLLAVESPVISAQLSERMKLSYPDIHFESTAQENSEVESLASIYPSSRRKLFTGALATEDVVKRESARSTILHIGAPALLDDTTPMSSFIALSNTGSNDDGFFQSREILNLQTTAKVAVLSHVSHIGNYSTAQLAMSWAWFVAGAPDVVLNRWETNSPSNAILLKEFHSRLRMQRLAKALQQSALSLRNSTDYKHPYYWAGWFLIGQ